MSPPSFIPAALAVTAATPAAHVQTIDRAPVPPLAADDENCPVIYADQVLLGSTSTGSRVRIIFLERPDRPRIRRR